MLGAPSVALRPARRVGEHLDGGAVARPVVAAAWDTAVASVACSCGGLRQLQRHERQDVGAVGGTGFPTHEITTLNS